MTNQVITFGCRLNTYESEAIKDLLQQAGHDQTIVINTCTVTAEAERQARQTIRKLARENPQAKIIVTGCAVQVRPEQFQAMPEVQQVLGNDAKMKLASYLSEETAIVNDIMAVQETASHLISGFDGKSRAYVQIQNGCNHRCTFCVIPYGRGNSRSVPVGEIVQQIQKLLENGFQEIVLTGVDITDYGLDLPGQPRLGQMVKRLLNLVPDLKRLRLTSLDPVEMDEDLWQIFGETDRLLPHLHLSLQAGDDLILKRMKRRHLRHHAIEFCERARTLRPDVVFGADLIAGFPTETEEMAQNSRRIVDECDLSFLHVFPYSPRPGTPASRMPQLDKSVIKERADALRQKGQEALSKLFQRLQGTSTHVLVESVHQEKIQGKTDHFAPITITAQSCVQPGHVIKAQITGYDQNRLIGKL